MQELIKEYKKSIKKLREAKVVPVQRNSMISDTLWAIDIMDTGKIPGTKWTTARWTKDKREIPIDMQNMACYLTNRRTAVQPLSEESKEILGNLLSTLTGREREAYYLVRGEKFSFAQAGRYMGCNKGSVQNFVSRAEKKINLVVRKQTISRGII